jgi:hypothetical protein
MERDRTSVLVPAMALLYMHARFDNNVNARDPAEFKRIWRQVLQTARRWAVRRGGRCCLTCRMYATLRRCEIPAHDLGAWSKPPQPPSEPQQQRAGYTGTLRGTRHELIPTNRLVLDDGSEGILSRGLPTQVHLG